MSACCARMAARAATPVLALVLVALAAVVVAPGAGPAHASDGIVGGGWFDRILDESRGGALVQGETTFAGCGRYVILGCFSRMNDARERAGNGFLAIDTRDYPAFRDGFFCVADGPYANAADAQAQLRVLRREVRDAYVKEACR